jgi:HEAT repeat protein
MDIEAIIDGIRTGEKTELPGYSSRIRIHWKDIPVAPLLSLKDQLNKMGMEDREAFLDEALISVALRRPGPFREIASKPSNPLWNAAAEILSEANIPEDLDLLIRLLPDIPGKSLPDLVRAIGRFRTERAVEAISSYLLSEDESAAFEAATALRDNGSPRAVTMLKEALRINRAARGARPVLEAIVRELEKKAA